MKKTAGILSAMFLGVALAMAGSAVAESDTYTAEEMAAIKLLHDFRACISDSAKDIERKQQAVYSRHKAQVSTMTDADLDAARVKMLIEQNPPMTEDTARKSIARFSRDQKITALARDEAQTKLRAMSSEELDRVFVGILMGDGRSEETARRQIKGMPDAIKIFFSISETMETKKFSALTDEDLDGTMTRKLLEQNSGITEDQARKEAAEESRESKTQIVTTYRAGPELSALALHEDIQDTCIVKLGIDAPVVKNKLTAFMEKHGRTALEEEVEKLDTLPQPAPDL